MNPRPASMLVACLLSAPLAQADERPWYPVKVVSDGHPAAYTPLATVSKAWRICALLPHARDRYWWGVSWGLTQEAGRHDIKLGIYQAGGYEHLDQQRKQFQTCLDKRADAILLAAISADGLDDAIALAARQGVPVIDLVNGVGSKLVTARSLVSFEEMSKAAVNYLLAGTGGRAISVAWLPGPKGAGWVTDAETGMRRAFQNAPVTLLHAGYGPPELSVQMRLVRAVAAPSAGGPDYFLGNAVAIEAAANFKRYNPRVGGQAIAFYATEPVVELIKQGRVLAAASDSPVLQARIAIDLALRALEKQPHARRVGPEIDMIDAGSVLKYDYRRIFAPSNERITQQALPDK